MRHYTQYCNGPPIHNLITFGTPHYGISALIPCPTPPTLSCLLAARAARAGIYRPWAQSHLVQAAYFRDTERLDEFYEVNEFVRDLNGERPFAQHQDIEEINRRKGKRGEGKGLKGLDNLVAIIFDDDSEFRIWNYLKSLADILLHNRDGFPSPVFPLCDLCAQ